MERSDGSQTRLHLHISKGQEDTLAVLMPESLYLIEAGYGQIVDVPEMKPGKWTGRDFESDADLAKWLKIVKKDPTESEIVARIVKRGNSSCVVIPS